MGRQCGNYISVLMESGKNNSIAVEILMVVFFKEITMKLCILKTIHLVFVFSVLFGISATKTSADQNAPLGIEQIDQLMQVAEHLINSEFEQAESIITALSAEGLSFANEMKALATWIENKKIGDPNPKLDIINRMQAAWKDAYLVPPASAGNNLLFKTLQGIPREYDSVVVEWISTRYQDYPTPFVMENARRLIETNPEDAAYWLALGIIRITFEVKRCNDPSLRDLPLLWGGYIVGAVKRFELANAGQRKKLFISAYKRIHANWDEVVPYDMKVWQPCRGTDSFTKSGVVPTEIWKDINEKVKNQVFAAIEKAEN